MERRRHYGDPSATWTENRAEVGIAAGTDVLIRTLAARQHGVVSRAQLLAAGVSRRAVDGRIAKRLLLPLHRGVFRVGVVAAPREREMAACLACGPAAVLSHRSAAVLWELLPAMDPPGPVEVTVRGRERRHAGIRVRRASTLRRDDVTRCDGIPVTTPDRTIRDIASTVPFRELERAVARALSQRSTTRSKLGRLVSRAPGRRGIPALRALLAGEALAFTRSEAEERMLALVRRAQLPEPQVNARYAGYEVDFLWRDERLVAEVDGYTFHADTTAFENDRRRDLVLVSRGMRVVRVTWRQLMTEPEVVLVRLAQALVQK